MLLSFVPYGVLPDGAIVGQATIGVRQRLTEPGGETDYRQRLSQRALVRISPSGNVLDTLVSLGALEGASVTRRGSDQRLFNVAIPFPQEPIRAVTPDARRVAVGTTDSSQTATHAPFDLVVVEFDGDTLLARRYWFAPYVLTAAAKEAALDLRKRAMSTFPPDVASALTAELRTRMPRTAPPISSILLGLDETIWLELRATSEGRWWLALDRRGEPIGKVLLPRNVRLQQADRLHLWANTVDADGLVDVVRYGISK